MTRQWQPNGSNADFWRSDNPLLAGWWRFGNEDPKNNFLSNEEKNSSTVYLSGLMVDSGPQKHHLIPFFVGSDHADAFEPVTSIAPWDATGSGLKMNWTNAAHQLTVFAEPALQLQDADNATDHGSLSFGPTMYSGLTAIGWAQIPDANIGGAARVIMGRSDQDTSLSTHFSWRLHWNQPSASRFIYALTIVSEVNYNFNGVSTTPTRVLQGCSIDSDSDPNFPRNRNEPFFFAVQVSREAVEANRSFNGNGSGIARIWLGTEASGFTSFKEVLFTGPDVQSTYVIPDTTEVPFSMFANARAPRGTSNNHLPSGSILDEVVYINDGFISTDRILHYALSGMTKVDTSDPEHVDFTPEFPEDNGLVAYWSFDEDDGHNTAPPTLNDPRLEFSLSGLGSTLSFQDGIQDGRCIRVTPANSVINTTDGELMLARNDYPVIPAISGLPLLFPSGHIVDEGMTYIGWMRAVPNGTVLQNGAFGWFGGAGRHNAFAIESFRSGSSTGRNAVSSMAFPSGRTALVDNLRFESLESAVAANNKPGAAYGTSILPSVVDSEWDIGDSDWHLYAGVFDIKTGMMYIVKDAKFLFIMNQQISSASGLSSEGLGPFQGFFGFVPRGTESVEYDNFAVYNRILSIPEMSGFGINNIGGAPVQTDLDTSFKHVVGYWPLDRFTNYDPESVSGFRVDDKSWYFHHLTNVSGLFSFNESLNSELTSITPSSLEVNVSGSMISLERSLHGRNLDASSTDVFSTSGFSAGAWVYIPSGDLQTQGNGSSGLFGTHMIMGAWGSNENLGSDDRSWFLGIEGNKLAIKFVESNETLREFTSTLEPTFNEPFFVGCNFFPSGSFIAAQMVKIESPTTAVTEYAIDTTFGSLGSIPRSVGPSGFSLLNAPERTWGFPSGTRIQHAFMNLGFLNDDRWQRVKRDAIEIQTLGSGSVSTSDPANISHWQFDRRGKFVIDFGLEQNHLFPINTDNHLIGVEPAIHSSGVTIRQQEYLDTLPGNPLSRRLDLGSGTQSWTVLGWLIPPVISNTDQHVILNKGSGPDVAPTGIKVYTPSDSLKATAVASGDITTAAQNGDLAPSEWNHLAVVYDRDNDEFAVIINGRYSGSSFVNLVEIPINNSGLSLGGRGDSEFNPLTGGSAFSGILDDWMMFGRALTLPEISGLAANTLNFNPNTTTINATLGMWMSGIAQNLISGLIGSFMHGSAQDIELIAGYVSGVSGAVTPHGGFIHGKAIASGLIGGFLHGQDSISGVFGHFMHGQDSVSGLLGQYLFGACDASDELDITLTFRITTFQDFDARLGVEKTDLKDFDARLGVIRITRPPECTLEVPAIGAIASGTPFTFTVRGSGIAQDQKGIGKVRFTFADFKGAEEGTLVDGVPQSGLYEASRTFDTPGWYTIKIEVLDTYGYRTSCVRPFLLIPEGSTSGAYLATLPGISISGTPITGSAIHRTFITHSISGLDTTSGLLEYTDFADQQESLVNSLEMPSGTQFINFVRTHDYTMPGHYAAVWAVSGQWGIVSDSLSDGIDYLV